MAAEHPAWPLSAIATAVLLDPGASGKRLLRVGVAELILSGAWRVDRPRQERRVIPIRLHDENWEPPVPASKGRLILTSGDHEVPLPAPLRRIDQGLRGTTPSEGIEVRQAVWRMLQSDADLLDDVRHEARRELSSLGLVEARTSRLRGTQLARTASGEDLAKQAREREGVLRRALNDGEDVGRALEGLGVLILLAGVDLARALRSALKPRGVDVITGDVWFAEAVSLGQILDAADDAGAASDAGGGGDGGDGGGGGGDG